MNRTFIYEHENGTVIFTPEFPPVRKTPDGDERRTDREDNVTASGLTQTAYEHTEVFRTLEFDNIPLGELPLWKHFISFAEQGQSFWLYPDPALGGDFLEWILEDKMWSPKLNFKGFAKLVLKIKRCFREDDVERQVQTLSANGAITIKDGTVLIAKTSAGAFTLAAPTAVVDDGKELSIACSTDFAHVVTITNIGTVNTSALPLKKGDNLKVVAVNGRWYLRQTVFVLKDFTQTVRSATGVLATVTIPAGMLRKGSRIEVSANAVATSGSGATGSIVLAMCGSTTKSLALAAFASANFVGRGVVSASDELSLHLTSHKAGADHTDDSFFLHPSDAFQPPLDTDGTVVELSYTKSGGTAQSWTGDLIVTITH